MLVVISAQLKHHLCLFIYLFLTNVKVALNTKCMKSWRWPTEVCHLTASTSKQSQHRGGARGKVVVSVEVFPTNLLGIMNVCVKFHSNPSNSY